jgi:hypothetical protein
MSLNAGRSLFLSGLGLLIAVSIATTPWTLRASRTAGMRAVVAHWISLAAVLVGGISVIVDLALLAFYSGPAWIQGTTDRADFRIPVCSVCLPVFLAVLAGMVAVLANFVILPPWKKPLRQQLIRGLHVAAVHGSMLASMMYCQD